VFALSNITHRKNITEADYFIIHITNKKKLMPKSCKMRYHCQVFVDQNKHLSKNIDNQHSGMVHEKHKG